jgi:NAD+ synthase (glutamine-hydrolysing)
MKVALAQINTTVGDIPGNETKIREAYQRAAGVHADIVLVPELATVGYPPRDLLLKSGFVPKNLEALGRLAAATTKTALLIGYVARNEKRPGREFLNCVALCQRGKVQATRTKMLLPTYDVFDEDRYFEPAIENTPVSFENYSLGLTICEDAWNAEDFWGDRRYRRDPVLELSQAGARYIFNVSASPWSLGKETVRRDMLARAAQKSRACVAYCNLVGGNDELVFDGTSVVFNEQGELLAEGKMFAEDFIVVDLPSAEPMQRVEIAQEEKVYRALVLGLRDYMHKCGFKSALLGLSGGIDSALTAVLAVDALGKENVRGVSLPSQFSSKGSLEDARALAQKLGIRYDVVPIQPMFESAKKQLSDVFKGCEEDTAEENIQARLRGLVLMAMSNKFGSLLLTTGNKSELAVGYCTLYGDMAGGLAVISDVPKTMVYRIAKWVNRETEIIPANSITKPPSAELRPNQTDQDSLPPYDLLDSILERYIVQQESAADIIKSGVDEQTVRRLVRLIDFNEYKRRQAAPGIKVTSKAFGSGRRIPIAQRYRE